MNQNLKKKKINDKISFDVQLLACVVVHVWTHFIGVYLSLTSNRLERSSFLSARNAVDAEVAAEYQSNRLVRFCKTSI